MFLTKHFKPRVQQAAYTLIPEDSREATHLRIGLLLFAHTPADMLEENLINIVNQINVGVRLITDPRQQYEVCYSISEARMPSDLNIPFSFHFFFLPLQVALLNYKAGKKVRAATAYAAAVKYLDTAISLLSKIMNDNGSYRCWDDDKQEETMDIYLEATMAHYLNIDFAGAEQLCNVHNANPSVLI